MVQSLFKFIPFRLSTIHVKKFHVVFHVWLTCPLYFQYIFPFHSISQFGMTLKKRKFVKFYPSCTRLSVHSVIQNLSISKNFTNWQVWVWRSSTFVPGHGRFSCNGKRVDILFQFVKHLEICQCTGNRLDSSFKVSKWPFRDVKCPIKSHTCISTKLIIWCSRS